MSDQQSETQGDLDQFLSEFDQQTTPPEQPVEQMPQPAAPPPPQQPQFDPDIAELKSFKDHYERQQVRQELDSTVNQIKEVNENLKDVDNDIIEGYLQTQASKDPRIAQAWMQRFDKPEAFKSVVNEIGKQLGEKFRPVDRKVTDDLQAVRAAVTEEAPQGDVNVRDLNKMSDAEFLAYKESLM